MKAAGARHIAPRGTLGVPPGNAGVRRSPLHSLRLQLSPTNRYVRITTDDRRISEYVASSYGAHVVDGHSPDERTDEGTIFTATSPATVTFNGLDLPRAATRPGKNPWTSGGYIVDQFVWRALASDPDWFPLYACAVHIDGRAVILAGPSGVGKTTIGLSLVRAGARMYGDEMILVHRHERTVCALSRRLMVRDGTLALLEDPALAVRIRAAGCVIGAGADAYVAFDRAALGSLPPPAPLGAVLIVGRGDTGAATLRPLSPARTALASRSYLGTRTHDFAGFAAFANAISGARCFDLTTGAVGPTAKAIYDAVCA